jgi:hypothetical protein
MERYIPWIGVSILQGPFVDVYIHRYPIRLSNTATTRLFAFTYQKITLQQFRTFLFQFLSTFATHFVIPSSLRLVYHSLIYIFWLKQLLSLTILRLFLIPLQQSHHVRTRLLDSRRFPLQFYFICYCSTFHQVQPNHKQYVLPAYSLRKLVADFTEQPHVQQMSDSSKHHSQAISQKAKMHLGLLRQAQISYMAARALNSSLKPRPMRRQLPQTSTSSSAMWR